MPGMEMMERRSRRYERLRSDGADEESNEEVGENAIKFKVKTLDNERTWDVEADKSWTVEQLKAHLKEEHKLEGKKIRLISLGRMLADPSTIGECGIKEGGFIHAALSDELPEDREAPSVLGGGGGGGVHLSMTRPMVAAGPRGNSEGARERGFDRLIHSGLSPAEIQFLRGQYHARRGNQIATQEELYAAEEEWLEENQERGIMSEGVGGGGAGGLEFEEEDASEGTQADFVLGCIMGFVFGIIMLFWIWDRGIVRKQKLGILCGIGANFTMGMMRYQNRDAVGGSAADGSSSMDPGMSQHAPASLSNLLFGSDVGVASNSTRP